MAGAGPAVARVGVNSAADDAVLNVVVSDGSAAIVGRFCPGYGEAERPVSGNRGAGRSIGGERGRYVALRPQRITVSTTPGNRSRPWYTCSVAA